jgi:hypothetical protein
VILPGGNIVDVKYGALRCTERIIGVGLGLVFTGLFPAQKRKAGKKEEPKNQKR